MSLIFENRQYGLGEWQEKEMDGEITRLRHQKRASGRQHWNTTHFQGTFMLLFFPLYSFKMGKMARSNISRFPDGYICTHQVFIDSISSAMTTKRVRDVLKRGKMSWK